MASTTVDRGLAGTMKFLTVDDGAPGTSGLHRANRASSIEIPYAQLEVQDQIGGGGFALVHRGTWMGTPVAVKQLFDPKLSEQLIREFREEVMTLSELRHPNIVQFLGASLTLPKLAMVTEYMPFNLHVCLHEKNVPFDNSRVVDLAVEMAQALVYLHHRSPAVVHRDIKPANCLLDRSWKLKLCDFGLASNSAHQAGAGTPAYMAPELLDNKPFNESVDVYAVGIVLWEMLTRELPWRGRSPHDVKAAVLAGQRPQLPLSCPKPLASLVQKCWHPSPSERPRSQQLLDMLKVLRSIL